MTAPLRQPASGETIVPVALGDRAYDIVIGRDAIVTLGSRIKTLRPGARVAILTDDNVAATHLARVTDILKASGIESTPIVVKPGESSKGYATFETVSQSLGDLDPPLSHLASPPGSGVVRLADGTMAAVATGSALSPVLAAIRAEDYARAYATASFWWTIGGEGFLPLVLVGHRMPDPYIFTGLLTGRLDGVPG